MGMEPLFALHKVDGKLGERHVRGAVLALDFLLAAPAAFGGRVLVAAALSGLVTAHRLAHELVANEVQTKGAHFALSQTDFSLDLGQSLAGFAQTCLLYTSDAADD